MSGSETQAPTLGKYQLIGELGHGGMAKVYLALAAGPAGFNKLVVVKQILTHLGEDSDFLAMFLDEARLAARLNHPNVVQTNEVGEDNGRYFLCMEYLEGQPFNRVLARLVTKAAGSARLSLAQQLRILADALSGLHYAHELCDFDGTPLSVVHRDMSPHNIFVTYAGQVKLVDFGIAKAQSSSVETRAGMLKGKVAYMAPEQALGEKVDRRADIFSIGLILWEILAGRRMFKGVPDIAAMHCLIKGDLPRPSSVARNVPPGIEAICMKAIAHNRADRHATAADLATDLETAIDALGEKTSVREVGAMVAQAFDSERQRIQALVEQTMTAARPRVSGTFGARRTATGAIPGVLPLIDGRVAEVAVVGTSDLTPAAQRLSPSSLTANTTDSDEPPKLGRARHRNAFLGLAVLGVGLGAGLFVIIPRARPPRPVAGTASSEAAVHRLRIESSPPGATVSEGATVVGKTPLSLPIDPRQGTRHVVLSLDGYMPYAVEQAPAGEDVRVLVPLAPALRPVSSMEAAAQTATPSSDPPPTRKPSPPRVTPRPPPLPKPPPSDINTAR
jgi:serine/threonine-protein kinase